MLIESGWQVYECIWGEMASFFWNGHSLAFSEHSLSLDRVICSKIRKTKTKTTNGGHERGGSGQCPRTMEHKLPTQFIRRSLAGSLRTIESVQFCESIHFLAWKTVFKRKRIRALLSGFQAIARWSGFGRSKLFCESFAWRENLRS